jgi:CheY-like chemotaxis protein
MGPREQRAGRILIVDDNEKLARTQQRVLSDLDAVVEISVSAQHALDRIVIGETFNVILCDVTMPLMSGCDLHDEIRRFAPEQAARMVFITGGLDERTEKAVAATGRPVLMKPFDPGELRTFIERFLR